MELAISRAAVGRTQKLHAKRGWLKISRASIVASHIREAMQHSITQACVAISPSGYRRRGSRQHEMLVIQAIERSTGFRKSAYAE